MTATEPIYQPGNVVTHAGQYWTVRSWYRDVIGHVWYGLTSVDGQFTTTVPENAVAGCDTEDIEC